jgi:hypothetical protein
MEEAVVAREVGAVMAISTGPKHAYNYHYQKEKEYRCVHRPKVSEQINKTSFKNFLGLCIHIYTSTNTSKTKLYSIDTKTLHV